jgi:hypothetical protein
MLIIESDNYKDALAVRNPHGGIIIEGQTVADTLQCVHCGAHWVPQKGSGKIRGFCKRCMGPVCGPGCARCVPHEKWLEMVEKASG